MLVRCCRSSLHVWETIPRLVGVMASGFSGPRRIHLGSARDCVLGVRLINGLGQHLKFGGEVMKNVAGYDLSRLSVGAFGTLGILTEISVKVLPIPEKEQTQVLECTQADALDTLSQLGRRPYPISLRLGLMGFSTSDYQAQQVVSNLLVRRLVVRH